MDQPEADEVVDVVIEGGDTLHQYSSGHYSFLIPLPGLISKIHPDAAQVTINNLVTGFFGCPKNKMALQHPSLSTSLAVSFKIISPNHYIASVKGIGKVEFRVIPLQRSWESGQRWAIEVKGKESRFIRNWGRALVAFLQPICQTATESLKPVRAAAALPTDHAESAVIRRGYSRHTTRGGVRLRPASTRGT